MKWYTKIFLGFFFFLLVNLITILILSCNINRMIVDGIIVESITEQIYQSIDESIEEGNSSGVSNEQIKKLLKTSEVQGLMNKYLEITMNSMIGNVELDEIEMERDILQYLNENKETLEDVVGQEITDEMIENTKKQLEGKEMSRVFQQTLNNTRKDLSQKEITIIKGYKVFISNLFRGIVTGLIVGVLFMIALIQKSFYQWISTLGKAMIVSGIFVLIMSIIVKMIVASMSNVKGFRMTHLLLTGVAVLVVGVIIVVVYGVLQKEKKDDLTKQAA